ncbi:reverse transcriptase domain-containing protein [Tanacetum coccineum]
MDHAAIKYLFSKQDAKPRLIRWILLLQEFDIKIKNKKGAENVAANNLSLLENPSLNDEEINDEFPDEFLMSIKTDEEESPWFAEFPNYLFEYILVAIEYVSKWAEAEALPTNDARVLVNFLKKIFSHFGIPKALISDKGTHFCNRQMEKILKKYGVHHRIAAYHPQTSGQVENTNIALKRILEKTVKDNPSVWSIKLDDALWAFRTAYKTPIGTTLYRLLYGKMCHLPFEIEHRAYWALRSCNPDLKVAGEKRFLVRKEFKAGDKVLLYNSKYKFKAPKLRPKWCGPFIVKHGYPSGYVELYDKHGGSFIVNGHRVKLYHDEEQLNELAVEEIHLMCEDGRMKAIPFMAPFPANYRETMPWASEKPYIYSVVENTCNEAKLYDLDKTGKGIVIENTFQIQENKKRRDECLDYLKYEESRVKIKCRSISKKNKSNYSGFQAMRSSCNEDMVKYEDPRPSTTRTRALNERFNKKISPARTQPPSWSVCRPAESLPPGSWSSRFSLHSRRNLDNQEGSRPSKLTLDTPLDHGTDIKL